MTRPFKGAPKVPAVPVLLGAAARDHDLWEAARDNGVGASDIGVIMGVSTFSSPYALWWQKHLHWRLPQTEAMADGHAHEEMVIEEFKSHHPELVVEKPVVPLWRHPVHEWMICTPDYLAVGYGEHDTGQVVPVETKWDASPGWGPSMSDQVPEQYRLQVMWQAYIFGADGGWLVNHKPGGTNRYREYWIAVDYSRIVEAIGYGQSFYVSLETGVSPDPDGSKAAENILQMMYAGVEAGTTVEVPPVMAEQWQRARDDVKAAEAYKREMDNRLREVLGTAERGIDAATGDVFVERRISKRAGYEVGPAVVDSLRRVGNGAGQAGAGVPAADRPSGAYAPAGPAGDEEAAVAPSGDPAGTIEFGTVEVLGVQDDQRAPDGLREEGQ